MNPIGSLRKALKRNTSRSRAEKRASLYSRRALEMGPIHEALPGPDEPLISLLGAL